MVKLVRRVLAAHFEAVFYVYLWANASLLAVMVGRPWLGAIGLVTVLPFVILYRRTARTPR